MAKTSQSKKGSAKGQGRRVKAKKDPNRPTKALAGYMFFSKDERARITEENPEMKMTEMSKVIGERWRNMDEEARRPYQKRADADKERYKKEMDAYNAKEDLKEADDDEEEDE